MLAYPPDRLLRKAEFLHCYKQIIEICRGHTLVPSITEALAALELVLTSLTGRISYLRRTPLTDALEALERRRDMALSGLHLLANSCSRHYEPSIAEAGRTLLEGINHFGKKLTLLNYMAKTEVVAALVSRLNGSGPLAEAANVLPLVKDWAQELWLVNEAFNETFINRSQIRAEQPTQTFTELRPSINEAYRLLADRIVAQQTLYPSDDMAQLIAELNELVEGYKRVANDR